MLLSGIQPSGSLHIGNYFGAIKPFIEYEKNEKFFLIADLHSMTTQNFSDISELTRNLILDMISLGVSPNLIIKQSDFFQIPFLSWILSKFITVQQLKRSHTYKSLTANKIDTNLSTFCYPILMSADIIVSNAEYVLIGKDQKQHLEITKEIVTKLNKEFNLNFNIPVSKISNINVLGIDGRKMSKSYNNCLNIFDSEENLKSSIYRIVTNSCSVSEKKDYKKCNLFKIYEFFSNKEELTKVKDLYVNGGLSYKFMKNEIFLKFLDYFKDSREKKKKTSFCEFHSDLVYAKENFKKIIDQNFSKIISLIKF